jgi:hypothetical protein
MDAGRQVANAISRAVSHDILEISARVLAERTGISVNQQVACFEEGCFRFQATERDSKSLSGLFSTSYKKRSRANGYEEGPFRGAYLSVA